MHDDLGGENDGSLMVCVYIMVSHDSVDTLHKYQQSHVV